MNMKISAANKRGPQHSAKVNDFSHRDKIPCPRWGAEMIFDHTTRCRRYKETVDSLNNTDFRWSLFNVTPGRLLMNIAKAVSYMGTINVK